MLGEELARNSKEFDLDAERLKTHELHLASFHVNCLSRETLYTFKPFGERRVYDLHGREEHGKANNTDVHACGQYLLSILLKRVVSQYTCEPSSRNGYLKITRH